MGRYILTGLCFVVLLTSCGKDDTPKTSGIVTIDNTTFFDQKISTYYILGFLFSEAKLVSTESLTPPDITVYGDGTILWLDNSKNLKPSFAKVGKYPDAASAKTAFDDLKTVSATDWVEWANPVNDNQIWFYRSGNDNYAKIRIISAFTEVTTGNPYAECKFEWVYQPDGSTTFPGK